jgi:hypothetical protein
MDTGYSVIIDKLSIKYMATTDELNNLINLLKVRFPFIKIRSWSMAQSIYNQSLSIRSNKKDGTIFIGFQTKWCKTKVVNSKLYFDLFLVFNPSKMTKVMQKIVKFIHRYFKREWTISSVDIAFDIPIKKDALYTIARNRRKMEFKCTFYFGKRNSRGQLKIYDKINEMAANNVIYDNKIGSLTRVEYTYKPNPKDKATKKPLKMDIKKHFDKSYQILNISRLDNAEKLTLIDVSTNGKSSVSKSKRRKYEEIVAKVGLAFEINDVEIASRILDILNDSYYSADLAELRLHIIKKHIKELKSKISLSKIRYRTYLKLRQKPSKTFLFEVYFIIDLISKPLLL